MKKYIYVILISLITSCSFLLQESRYRYDGAEIKLTATPDRLHIVYDTGYFYRIEKSTTIISKHDLNNTPIWEFTRDTVEYKHIPEIPIWLRLEVLEISDGDSQTIYKTKSKFSEDNYQITIIKNRNDWNIELRKEFTDFRLVYIIPNSQFKILKKLNAKNL